MSGTVWFRVYKKVLALSLVICSGAVGASESIGSGVLDRGKNEFMDTCALCHGEDARGGGPLAQSLSVEPPNLTKILTRNEGEFPFLDLYFIIDGQTGISAHGTRKMPVWGGRYRREHEFGVQHEFGSETYATGKIMELILYLYSIQE